MGRTREKETHPVSVSSPKLVRRSPSSINYLCNGDLALAHISTALKHPAATSVSHTFGWVEKSCQSGRSRDFHRLCPMGPDAIGQESPSCAQQFPSGTVPCSSEDCTSRRESRREFRRGAICTEKIPCRWSFTDRILDGRQSRSGSACKPLPCALATCGGSPSARD